MALKRMGASPPVPKRTGAGPPVLIRPGAGPPVRAAMSAFVLATLAACGSCGDGRLACYPVSGSVTYRGQPAAGARMIFHPIGGSSELQCQRPVATVQEDGSFAVTTFFKSDGAPVGEYTVTIIWVHNRQLADGEDLRGGRASRNLLPNKYSSPETSDLRATVRKGTNVLTTFEL